MKTISKILFLFISLSVLFFSCTKSPSKLIVSGTWAVSLYMHDGKVETSDYDFYIFDFKKDKTLVVTLPSGALSIGSWNYDDAISKYRISISGTDKLDKINEDWIVIATSSTNIELRDDDSSKNELLSFRQR